VTVLPEIPDRRRALAELRRVLKPGGVLSITEEFVDPDYPLRHGNWWIYTLNFQKTV
jgi:ubiquinone/menaquinone biosynthesis C-methylase UbiE